MVNESLDPEPADDGAALTPVVISAVEREVGSPCATCGRVVCGHDVVRSFVLGFKGSTRCLDCLARGLQRDVAGLHDHLLEAIHHRECWTAGWRRANELEKFPADARPACSPGAAGPPRPSTEKPQPKPRPLRGLAPAPAPAHAPAPAPGAAPDAAPDVEWDAGDLACGDLVLELRIRMRALRPGQVLKLVASDPGAPADLPAWCGLTGQTLLAANHPVYMIRRKED